ncbi:branched-chain amino acid ABC transporter permease [Thermus thalpophilus]|uniref:branched-chain amino acid ABC transporter permease n=1 Tax=Thermus thalpophilus TaxID=2908147 RepID=UPI001FAACA1C|nr:branched-chain amino acid ABC transporter permease [Thermus thalpophilus]
MELGFYLLQLLTGMAYASTLFLLAVGLSLIFGAMGIVNFAHGSFYMLGAYLLYAFARGQADGFWQGLLLVGAAGVVIGAMVERLFIRPIYRRPEEYQILLTYALLLILEDLVRFAFGAAYRSFPLPPAFASPLFLLGTPFPSYYLFLVGLAALVALLLWLFLQRTRLGVWVRAATQDREMLEALGVNVPLLYTSVFAGGIALAALGGAVLLPLQAATPGMAVDAVIQAFIVVVIGGLGSVWGALLGAVLLGLIQAFGILWLPEMAMVFPFALMALVLLLRPWGLLGRPPAVRT